jgi:tripartite-type tricarboxylate transporter receptor subunit TctC
MLAPARFPPALTAQVNGAVTKMFLEPDFKERLAHEGAQPAGGTPAQFAAYIKSEIEKWAKIVRMAKVKIE